MKERNEKPSGTSIPVSWAVFWARLPLLNLPGGPEIRQQHGTQGEPRRSTQNLGEFILSWNKWMQDIYIVYVVIMDT